MEPVLTITPDFNRPPDKHGIRTDILRSKSAIEDAHEGYFAPGTKVIAFFDPASDSKNEYEYGWSVMCTIVSSEIEAVHDGTEAVWLRYTEDDRM